MNFKYFITSVGYELSVNGSLKQFPKQRTELCFIVTCRLVANGRRPLVQVVKRLAEANHQPPSRASSRRAVVHCNTRDGVFLLRDDSIAFVDERLSNDDVTCRIIPRSSQSDFYTVPCHSTLFNVSFITERSSRMPRRRKVVALSELNHKVVCLPHNDGFVLLPMCHGDV